VGGEVSIARVVRGWLIRPAAVFLMTEAFLLVPLDPKPCLCQPPFPLMEHSSGTLPEALDPSKEGDSGYLSKLNQSGMHLHLNYTGEAFHGFRVLPDGATRYRGLVELEVSLDTGKAGLWPGGELFVKGQNGHGEGFIVNPGGVPLPLSDIGAPDFTQVSEYGLKQQLADGHVTMILGKQNANDYFSVNRFGGSFIFPAYTLIPTVPMPTFPAYALGTSVLVEPAEWLSLDMGVYDGAPEIGGLGFDTAFDGKDSFFSILELTWKPAVDGRDEHTGHYSLGMWYQSGDFANTQPDSGPGTLSGNYGWYLMLDRLLFREPSSKADDQGLGGFFQFGWAPEDRNAVAKYVGAGFTYKGLFPNRDEDKLGIGVSYTWLVAAEPAAGAETHLTTLELFYEARVNSWLSLQPDVQYCDNPGDGLRNGFAVGIRWVVNY
jgi:porin